MRVNYLKWGFFFFGVGTYGYGMLEEDLFMVLGGLIVLCGVMQMEEKKK